MRGGEGLPGRFWCIRLPERQRVKGSGLEEVTRAARNAASALGTMGVSLSAGTVPAVGHPSFTLAENEVELGLGIHGEPGVERIEMEIADAIADRLPGLNPLGNRVATW